MDKNDANYAAFTMQKEAIERVLVDNEMSEDKAKEIAFHIAEILPDFEAVSEGIKKGTLTYDQIAGLVLHLPYHARSLEEEWFK
jgi:hypothetical protein